MTNLTSYGVLDVNLANRGDVMMLAFMPAILANYFN